MKRTILRGIVLGAVVLLGAALTFELSGLSKDKGKGKKEEPKPEDLTPVWPSPLDPGKNDPVFRELSFGKGRDEFVALFKERLAEQLKPILKATPDARERDSLRHKMEKIVDEFTASYTEFVGQQTGYAVSVVADDFVQNAGEALYKYPYSQATAYFFFSGNILYRLFICSEADAAFPDLLVRLAQTYGDPKTVEFKDEEKTIPLKAVWKDTTFEFVAQAPQGIFACSRLAWTYLPELPNVQQRRAALGPPQQGGTSTDDLLKQIGEDKAPPDPLDKILQDKNKQK